MPIVYILGILMYVCNIQYMYIKILFIIKVKLTNIPAGFNLA